MKKIVMFLVCLSTLAATAVAADKDLRFASELTNQEFSGFVQQAGTAMANRSIASAEPLGLIGFDAAISLSFMEIGDNEWQNVLDDGKSDVPGFLILPKIQVRKGLPFNINVGASLTTVPESNIALVGIDAQYSLLEGTVVTPAVAIRGGYTYLAGVDDLDLGTITVDAVVSKGLTFLTPYAGIGYMRADASYAGDDSVLKANLDDQTFEQIRYFGGVEAAIFVVAKLSLEVELGEEDPVYSLKFGFSL